VILVIPTNPSIYAHTQHIPQRIAQNTAGEKSGIRITLYYCRVKSNSQSRNCKCHNYAST